MAISVLGQLMLPDDFIITAGNGYYDYSDNIMSILKDGTVINGKPVIEDDGEIAPDSFVKTLGAGWNLGNTLDAHGEWIELYTDNTPADYETAWGKPITTKEMIDTVKAKGFKTLRVPSRMMERISPGGNVVTAGVAAWKTRSNFSSGKVKFRTSPV